MDEQQHHAELIKGISEAMKPVLEKSKQAVYVYLDDNHKVCNKKYSDLLGYKSTKEWADKDAPLSDVVEEDQQKVIDAYMEATEKMTATVIEARFTHTKTAKMVKTRIITAPVGHAGHVFTAHFIEKI